MDGDSVFKELMNRDSHEFDIFLDTLKEVFDNQDEKGKKHHE